MTQVDCFDAHTERLPKITPKITKQWLAKGLEVRVCECRNRPRNDRSLRRHVAVWCWAGLGLQSCPWLTQTYKCLEKLMFALASIRVAMILDQNTASSSYTDCEVKKILHHRILPHLYVP